MRGFVIPDWIRATWLRVRALLKRHELDRDLSEELGFHLAMRQEKNEAAGMTPEDARAAARRRFGNSTGFKEVCREMWTFTALETVWQDIRYGLRQLRRNPGFTAVAVITLTLGIGANTAIFSLIDAVMFKLLPVKQPEQLFVLDWASQGRPYFIHGVDAPETRDRTGRMTSTGFSYPVFEAIEGQNRVFSSVMGFSDDDASLNLSANGQSVLATGEFVSGDYFSTLGIRAAAGRTLIPADDRTGASPAAVISYNCWTRRFGRDPSVVGKAITVNSIPFTVVGVIAPGFSSLQSGSSVEAWIPLHTHPQVDPSWSRWLPKGKSLFMARGEWWVEVIGRLRPGVTLRNASAQLSVILQQNTAGIEAPPMHRPGVSLKPPGVELTSAANGLATLRQEFSRPLLVLMVVVALVLLVACANVASLLLGRSASRQKEIAVRLALGGARHRLIRQLLTESALLAGAGGMVGTILAYWASDALVAVISSGRNPVQLQVSPDLRVLGFTALTSALTVVLFGLVPSLGATRLDLTEALKEGGGIAAGTRSRWRAVRLSLRGSLVVSQVAISVVLLIGAGLFLQTLTNLVNQNLGFDRRNLLLFRIDPSQAGYKRERLASFYQELQRRIEALPGVHSASLSLFTLVDGGMWGHGISIPGYIPKPGEAADGSIETAFQLVGSGFFETLGIHLLLGRSISGADITNSPKVCVINQAFADKYFGNSNPIGRQLGFNRAEPGSDMTVVGVVGNAKYGHLSNAPPPTVFIPFPQYLDRLGAMYFEVRTVGNPTEWISSVRQVVRGLDRRVPLVDIHTQREQIEEATFQARLFASLTSLFALLTLLLACVGLYGNLAYAVSQRTNEIGVRMALGGQPQNIITLVLWQGAELTLIGLAIGAIVAFALTRLIASFLFGLAPTDPRTFASAVALLTVAALLACYLPARRAAKVDPMVALRHE